jgi:hypothetical protein
MPWTTVESGGQHSFGTTLYYAPDGTVFGGPTAVGTDLPGPWVRLNDIINITSPENTPGDTKVTHTRSPDKAHEYTPGWVEGAMANFRLLYSKETMGALDAVIPTANATAPDWDRLMWAVQFPDGGVAVFRGYFKGYPITVPGADSDDPVAIDVSVKVSGKATFHAS